MSAWLPSSWRVRDAVIDDLIARNRAQPCAGMAAADVDRLRASGAERREAVLRAMSAVQAAERGGRVRRAVGTATGHLFGRRGDRRA